MSESVLKGKTVVVTGAAGRLGRHLGAGFAEAGANVVPVSRDAAAAPYRADLAVEAEVEACFAAIAREAGPPDVLVHAAGAWDSAPLLDTRLADWDALMRTNLTSAFLCFREAARYMRPGGRLIAFAAAQGADAGRAGQAAYAASKAGVIRLVESVAAELEPRGITAHAIAPSTILYDAAASGAHGVRVQDLVQLCLYVAGPAGAALTGATLRAYGGAV